jgi:galactokinase
LEVASLLMFQQSSGLELGSPLDIAKLAQRAENEFVGVKCGLMDQLISAAGQADHAMSINFTTLEMNSVRVPDEIAVVVGDTKLSRKLAGSTYNVRRTECEEAVAIINSHRPESKLASLSDLDEDYFGQIQSVLTGKRLQRARHVVTENQRVRSSLQALRDKDFERLGVLFSESHASLRDDYEVSSEGLNRLVETMEAQPECWGARLTGAGFGGCTIAIVPQESAHRFIEKVVSNCTGFETKPDLFITLPSNGGQVFPVE